MDVNVHRPKGEKHWLTIGKGADGCGRDPCVDASEAPGLGEALLALQPGLNGVQREEGEVNTHPCTATCLRQKERGTMLLKGDAL